MPKAKKKPSDKTYSASTDSPLIRKLQLLVQDPRSQFQWAEELKVNEVNFVYDMLANAEAKKGFMPTRRQGVWLAEIYAKIAKNHER